MNFWTSGGDADRARRVLEQNSFPEDRFEVFDLRSGALDYRAFNFPQTSKRKNSCPRWSNIHVYHHHHHHHSQARNEIWESSIYLVRFINLRKKGKMIICWKWKILQRMKLTYLWTILSRGNTREGFSFSKIGRKRKGKKSLPFGISLISTRQLLSARSKHKGRRVDNLPSVVCFFNVGPSLPELAEIHLEINCSR